MLDHVGVELGSGDLLQRTRAELKEFDIHASIHASLLFISLIYID